MPIHLCTVYSLFLENLWPSKPKIFTIWSFIQKDYQLLFYIVSAIYHFNDGIVSVDELLNVSNLWF